MKALTLTQPYATLVAIGAKKIETRSWSTNYRGRLAIHAAKGLAPVGGKKGFEALCGMEPFCSVLNEHGRQWLTDNPNISDLLDCPPVPFGAIIATVTLATVIPITQFMINKMSDQEIAFGDYAVGRFAWVLRDVEILARPVRSKGALGLWEWKGE